ncbi:hypothetical protein AGMMS49543_04830 [Betaproteobacteria bacterium]|nr:hypothetical protein AGMMS49543_04830 [Betaproteobacteria bacterium]GHU20398.1 hypothetical protein AGMMS50243_14930 [Betaproteobacteria bacterium]
MKLKLLSSLVLGAIAMTAATSVSALSITTTNNAQALLDALLAPNSGINIVNGSLQYIGAANQGGTYTGLNVSPSDGVGATITNPDGILLTTGTANLPTTNTSSTFHGPSGGTGTGPNGLLTALSGISTVDQNVLSFQFTVDSGVTALAADLVFGSDEFPNQYIGNDIFGFFVDGVDYANIANGGFTNGGLVQNTPATNFQNNPLGSNRYPIEFNGITTSHHLVGQLDSALNVHTLYIAIADIFDYAYESGVFIGGLTANQSQCTGSGCNPNPNPVPEPSILALLGLGLAGLGVMRRRKHQA